MRFSADFANVSIGGGETNLEAFFGISKNVRCCLLLVSLATEGEDGEAFLAAWWVNKESLLGVNETIVLGIVNIVHLEWTAVFDVSVATQFDTIDLVAECEACVLQGDASSELAVKEADLAGVLWSCRCEVYSSEDGKGNQKLELHFDFFSLDFFLICF